MANGYILERWGMDINKKGQILVKLGVRAIQRWKPPKT